MSRVANNPIVVPKGVSVDIQGQVVSVTGSKGTLDYGVDMSVQVDLEDGLLRIRARRAGKKERALAGTTRAVLGNIVKGVDEGFQRKLTLVGVGYRAQAKGDGLNLSLGYSHPVEYRAPEGVTLETPSQTEVIVRGCDRQQVGQVAADIRAFRPPEPYKGKGIRYADEDVVRKEAKKK